MTGPRDARGQQRGFYGPQYEESVREDLRARAPGKGGLEGIPGFNALVADGVPYNTAAAIVTAQGYQELDDPGIDYVLRLYLANLGSDQPLRFNAEYAVAFAGSPEGRGYLEQVERIYQGAIAEGRPVVYGDETEVDPEDFYNQAYGSLNYAAYQTGTETKGEEVRERQGVAFEGALRANQQAARSSFEAYQAAGGELGYGDWFNERQYQYYRGGQGYLVQNVPLQDPNKVRWPSVARGYGPSAAALEAEVRDKQYGQFQTALGGLPAGAQSYFGPRFSGELAKFKETGQDLTWDEYLSKYLPQRYGQLSPRQRGEYGARLAPRTRTLNY